MSASRPWNLLYFLIPEMASERMRIWIRKFEPGSDAISSRYLATPARSEMPQTAARAILGRSYGSFPLGPTSFAKGLSDFLAFQTHTQNYFELDCVFSPHPWLVPITITLILRSFFVCFPMKWKFTFTSFSWVFFAFPTFFIFFRRFSDFQVFLGISC